MRAPHARSRSKTHATKPLTNKELRDIARELKQPIRQDGTWQDRAAAMRRLHGLLLGGAPQRLPSFAHLFHTHMIEPLSLQLKDLRSKCVKLACEVICEGARALGPSFRPWPPPRGAPPALYARAAAPALRLRGGL